LLPKRALLDVGGALVRLDETGFPPELMNLRTRQAAAAKGKEGHMRSKGRLGLAVVVAALVAAMVPMLGAENRLEDGDGEERGQECNDATIRGDYGIQIQGTRVAPNGMTESVIGVVLRNYDGRGNITQVDNVKGSITGITPDRQGFGTYQVNPDCTGVAEFHPGANINLEERMVIVDDGREIRTITASPAGVMVLGVHQRVDEKRDRK